MPFLNPFEEVPEDSILLIEDETGGMMTVYAGEIATSTGQKGKRVTYLTTHPAKDVQRILDLYSIPVPATMEIRGDILDVDTMLTSCRGALCVIDPFTSFVLDMPHKELQTLLFTLVEISRKGTTLILLADQGILPVRSQAIVRSVVDGVIRFVATTDGDRIKRYIHVLKMTGALPTDRMLPVTISDEGITVDTRERHG